jgi:hypothetical protein
MEIEIKISVSQGRISDLLCNAFEGGSNYWYLITSQKKPPVLSFRSDVKEVYPHLDYPLNEGGSLKIQDMEGENRKKRYTLDLEAVKRGLEIMARDYPRHWADFISENDDGDTGDVFLQCCLFGEAIYG